MNKLFQILLFILPLLFTSCKTSTTQDFKSGQIVYDKLDGRKGVVKMVDHMYSEILVRFEGETDYNWHSVKEFDIKNPNQPH